MAAVCGNARHRGDVCLRSEFVIPVYKYWRTVLARADKRKPRSFGSSSSLDLTQRERFPLPNLIAKIKGL